MKKYLKKQLTDFSEIGIEETFESITKNLPPIQPIPDQFEDLYYKYTERGKIILQPDFQRDFIWPVKKQKELIKSVWQGIPIPMFYFSQKDDGRLEVIDGQQRLTTLFGFYDRDSLPRDIRNKIVKKIVLNADDKKISETEIREKMKRSLLLHCVIFDEAKFSPSQKYEIFRRLNQGSMVLKPQEIRNCILQSELPPLNSAIKKLTKLFARRLGSEFRFTRMFGEELVLRFFIINKYGYERRISDYINFSIDKRLRDIKKDFDNTEIISKCSNQFKKLVERIYALFGDNCFQVLKKDEEQPRYNHNWHAHIFSGVFNQGLFHLFSFYLPKYEDNQFNKIKVDNIRVNFLNLLKNKKFVNLISGAATDQTSKIKASKELFEKEFLYKCLGNWTIKDDRNISKQAKKTLFKNIPYCYLCYGKLNRIEDADHIDPYSKGHKSKFFNILLTHAKCNKEKSNKTIEEYRRTMEHKLIRRIRKNKKCINEFLCCFKKWNKIYKLNDYKKICRFAKTDLAIV